MIMRGRICLVTGATSGIGFETAAGLAARGATVLVAGPDQAQAERALGLLRARVQDASAFAFGADLSRMAEVRALAGRVGDAHGHVDVLVNNAGIYSPRRSTTADGYEATLAVNFLAPFLLTSLLWPRLRERGDARIVNISSVAHVGARFDFDDPHFERRRYHGYFAYAASKLAILSFTRELAARSPSPGPTSNAVHPGVVATSLVRNVGWLGHMLAWVSPVLGSSAHKAAATALHVACAPDLVGETGGYFVRSRPRAPASAATDPALATRLWALAESLTDARWDL
jgi:NAD(P)-dependent dehydrogenase (short-subunit alcohol dehydrogenase family)